MEKISKLEELDKIDMKILSFLQEEPELNHTDIAKLVNRSQPAIGSRIRKLKELGILQHNFGISIQNTPLKFSIVSFNTSEPKKIKKILRNNPLVSSIIKITGERNIMVFLVSLSELEIYTFVQNELLTFNCVNKVKFEIVTEVPEEFMLNINIEYLLTNI